MFPFRFSFHGPGQPQPQASAQAQQALSRFFCHECNRTSDHAPLVASDDAMQQIPQCPHCGSEFLEERELEARQPPPLEGLPPQPQLGLAGGLAGMLQQMQQQMHQQIQASRYPPAPQQEGPRQAGQGQPGLEAIFRSLMQMQGGPGAPLAGMAAPLPFPGLFQGQDNRSFQDILDHLFQQRCAPYGLPLASTLSLSLLQSIRLANCSVLFASMPSVSHCLSPSSFSLSLSHCGAVVVVLRLTVAPAVNIRDRLPQTRM